MEWIKITKETLPPIGKRVLLKGDDLDGPLTGSLQICDHCGDGQVWVLSDDILELKDADYWAKID